MGTISKRTGSNPFFDVLVGCLLLVAVAALMAAAQDKVTPFEPQLAAVAGLWWTDESDINSMGRKFVDGELLLKPNGRFFVVDLPYLTDKLGGSIPEKGSWHISRDPDGFHVVLQGQSSVNLEIYRRGPPYLMAFAFDKYYEAVYSFRREGDPCGGPTDYGRYVEAALLISLLTALCSVAWAILAPRQLPRSSASPVFLAVLFGAGLFPMLLGIVFLVLRPCPPGYDPGASGYISICVWTFPFAALIAAASQVAGWACRAFIKRVRAPDQRGYP